MGTEPKEKKPRAKRRNFALEIESLKIYVTTKLEVLSELHEVKEGTPNSYSAGQINSLEGVLKKMEAAK